MAQVVPSQVVEIIDQLFPAARKQKDDPSVKWSVSRSNQHELAALVDLVEKIQPELITVDPKIHANFILAINVIKAAFPSWQYRDYQINCIMGYSDLNPVTLILDALSKCSDEGVTEETSELEFISDVDFRASLRQDISSANQAFSSGEWKATTILAGATIEALLLYRLELIRKDNPAKIKDAVNDLVSKQTLSKPPGENLEKWSLYPLIEVASHVGLIKDETAVQARLAKDFRNLIHPGVSKRKNLLCNRGTALSALAALEHTLNDFEDERDANFYS